MSNETITIELSAQTNKVGSKVTHTVEFDLEDWNAMEPTRREEYLLESLLDSGLISWDWRELP